MEKEDFIKRLTELRINKGVSARDMSLSIGQSAGYINNIENGVMRIDTEQRRDFICRWDLCFLWKNSGKYGIFKLLRNLNEDWLIYVRIYIQS